MAVLFLIQTLVGAASQHYRADITSFLGVDPGADTPVQSGADLASAARNFLGFDVLPRRRHFFGTHAEWPRAENSEVARDRAFVSAGGRRLRQPYRRVRRDSRLDTKVLEPVWRSGF